MTGLTTAATIFVVASIGMAAGGGLYITAVFATAVILIALALLGKAETRFSLKALLHTYEVVAKGTDMALEELDGESIQRVFDYVSNRLSISFGRAPSLPE